MFLPNLICINYIFFQIQFHQFLYFQIKFYNNVCIYSNKSFIQKISSWIINTSPNSRHFWVWWIIQNSCSLLVYRLPGYIIVPKTIIATLWEIFDISRNSSMGNLDARVFIFVDVEGTWYFYWCWDVVGKFIVGFWFLTRNYRS